MSLRRLFEGTNLLTINVAVIDDHDVIRSGIQQILSTVHHARFIGGFPDLEAFRLDPGSSRIDVLILDDTLPFSSVYQAVRQLTAEYPHLAMIILGCKLNAGNMQTLAELGAAGFICKYDSLRDILSTAIRQVHKGQTYLSPEATFIKRDADSLQSLSPRLEQVLILIEQGLYVQQIAQELDISDRAVYSARRRLRAIFDAATDAQMIAKAIRAGVLDSN